MRPPEDFETGLQDGNWKGRGRAVRGNLKLGDSKFEVKSRDSLSNLGVTNLICHRPQEFQIANFKSEITFHSERRAERAPKAKTPARADFSAGWGTNQIEWRRRSKARLEISGQGRRSCLHVKTANFRERENSISRFYMSRHFHKYCKVAYASACVLLTFGSNDPRIHKRLPARTSAKACA
jgi:hypothetical protein